MKTFVALCWMLACSLASAQDHTSYVLQRSPAGVWAECAPPNDCRASPGARGVWFELEVAQRLVLSQRALVELQSTLQLTEKKGSLLDDRLQLCEVREYELVSELSGTKFLLGDARVGKAAAEQRATRAESSLSAWYNRKGLWFGVGVLSAVALGGGAFALVR